MPPSSSSSGKPLTASSAPPASAAVLKARQRSAARASIQRTMGAPNGSSSTFMKLYSQESPGLKIDPVVVLVLSVSFILSVVVLHIMAKLAKYLPS